MKKICIITSSRADYGILKTLMLLLKLDPCFKLNIIVTGSHLNESLGSSFNEIINDGFEINAKIDNYFSGDSNSSTVKMMASAMLGVGHLLEDIAPDAIVLVGDRFEIFAVASAAYTLRIPIIHIHGGEVTSGALDDGYRHAISKLSTLHFVAHEEYKKRLIRMGEQPNLIYNVGAPGIDLLKLGSLKNKQDLSAKIGINLDKYFLITLHPTTLDNISSDQIFDNLFQALRNFPDFQFVVTKGNLDPTGELLNKKFNDLIESKYFNGRMVMVNNLSKNYFSAIKHSSLVLGNSSSGILEAPYLNTPTVNIGKRQNGRVMPESVITIGYDTQDIINGIETALSETWRKSNLKLEKNWFGKPGCISENILNVLKKFEFNKNIGKVFYDK
jgi:GDP/UDP-N,N'-diacetylbacillosamine 2-epimerase (hydrolysing)